MKASHTCFIDLPLFRGRILFSVGTDQGDLRKFLEKSEKRKFSEREVACWEEGMSDPKHADGMSLMFDNGVSLLWIRRAPKTPADMGTLAHEAFHNTALLFKRIGVKFSGQYDETYAYTTGYIVEKAMEALR